MNCKTCSKPLGARNKTGYCVTHLNAVRNRDPEFRAKAAAGMRRALAHNPELREMYRRNAIALRDLPQTKAAKRERWMAEKPWLLSNAGRPAGSESRRRAGARQSETLLAAIPREARDLYRELTRIKGYRADEAQRIVLEQHERDMARFSAKIAPAPASRTEAPEIELAQVESIPADPVLAVAALLGVHASDVLSAFRDRPLVDARAVASVVMRRQGLSFPAIGRKLGRDHTSIVNLVQSFDARTRQRPHLLRVVERLAA